MFYWLYCHHWKYGDRELQFYPEEFSNMVMWLDRLARKGWTVKVKVFNNEEI